MKPSARFPIVAKALEDKGISPELHRTIGVVALALPDPKRLVSVGFLPKWRTKRDPLLAGLFKPDGDVGVVSVNRKSPRAALEQTVVHELGHCLDWGVKDGRCRGHDLGFGCCWSLVYRIYIGELFGLRLDGRGGVWTVDVDGHWYSATA